MMHRPQSWYHPKCFISIIKTFHTITLRGVTYPQFTGEENAVQAVKQLGNEVGLQQQAAWLCSTFLSALWLILYSQQSAVHAQFTCIIISVSLPSTPQSTFKGNQLLDLSLVIAHLYSFPVQKFGSHFWLLPHAQHL